MSEQRSGEALAEREATTARRLGVLPLKNVVVFPHMVIPLYIGRPRSLRALKLAMEGEKEICLVTQRSAEENEPGPRDLYSVGTVGVIVQHIELPDNTLRIFVKGKQRVKIARYLEQRDYLEVEVEELEDEVEKPEELEALVSQAKELFKTYGKLNRRISREAQSALNRLQEPGKIADSIAAQLSIKAVEEKQALLEELSCTQRLQKILTLLQGEVERLQVERKIRTRVKKQMEKNQKEYYLNEQMQAIQRELGERDEAKGELSELEEQIEAKSLPDEASERLKKELKKLKSMNPMSAEATVLRNYVDWVLALPWDEASGRRATLRRAEEILNEDHYGLKKPKERILEYLAVLSLTQKLQGPILCMVGPPGVGKTSLARSIARCTDREFVRISLGGVRDEAEIRGHRRTYIGAMPGKIMQAMKRAGKSDPVILLDEIDKMNSDFRGDPAAALLEVLDPEQHHAFNDHYIELDYDLSKVIFITTANHRHQIPLPLQDRLEIIELSGYTENEKLSIAQAHLLPRQIDRHGLEEADLSWGEDALRLLINRFTRESGVRTLDRKLAALCRKVARKALRELHGEEEELLAGELLELAEEGDEVTSAPSHAGDGEEQVDLVDGGRDGEEAARADHGERADDSADGDSAGDDSAGDDSADDDSADDDSADESELLTVPSLEGFQMEIGADEVVELLGDPPYRIGSREERDEIGLVNGLAYTSWGGNLLQNECMVMTGKGKLTITGQLGEVMQESARAALSFVRSRAERLGLDQEFHQNTDIHMHFPEGAIPKDGPSAGVTMTTALVSALRKIPVRREVAMTGEITLRGRVLPIGGLKEKLLAARRGQIQTVFIPQENEKDLKDVPDEVRSALEIIPVEHVDSILERAFHLDGPLWQVEPPQSAARGAEAEG